MHEITNHCAYLFCLNSLTFQFSCKDDYDVNQKKTVHFYCNTGGLAYSVHSCITVVVLSRCADLYPLLNSLSLPYHLSYSFISQWMDTLVICNEIDVYRLVLFYFCVQNVIRFRLLVSMQNDSDRFLTVK